MERLDRLFGSPARLRLLRLFIFNQDTSFTLADAASRSSLESATTRRELTELASAGLIYKKGTGVKAKYHINPRFEHLAALDTFVRETTALSKERILGALKRVGTLRVITLSGLFTGAVEAQIDLLVAGDNLDTRALARAIRALEAELGREIRYAAFETADFRYRLGVYDRLLRDVFDYPHRVLVDRVGL